MTKKTMIWSRVNADVKETVQRLADSMGVSISEYIRTLVLRDLDKRSVFTAQFKRSEDKFKEV
jgi:antitoxin component of RelBE/YafQ-DinJ toxin-antitoxin module